MKYTAVLIIVLIPVVIILTNFSLMATNYNYYLKIYKEQNIYSNFSDKKNLNSATINLIDYFRGNNVLEQNYYSNQAVLHLKDVKYLLNIVHFTTLGSILLLLSAIALAVNKKEIEKLIKAVIIGVASAIILTIIIVAALIVNFQNMFIYFHLALFRNSHWLFDESDNLINMFPQRFFVSFAYHLVTNIIVTALVLLLATLILKKINDKPHT